LVVARDLSFVEGTADAVVELGFEVEAESALAEAGE
jgi:hypothetical protein